jgi:hypothetical protein
MSTKAAPASEGKQAGARNIATAMSKTAKIGLLAATAWPMVYILLFTGFVFSMMLRTSSAGQAPGWFAPLMVVHVLTMLWCLAQP